MDLKRSTASQDLRHRHLPQHPLQHHHQHSQAAINAVAGAFGSAAAAAAVAAMPPMPTVTDYNLAAQLTTIGLTIPQEVAGGSLLHPTAIKHEQQQQSMCRDDLLSSFGISTNSLANSISPTLSSWMTLNTLNSPAGVTALASLKALMQANDGEAVRLAAAESEVKPQFADMSKLMETRNHSTESTASTSTASGTQGMGGESIPRKQDIQTDIRMNKGRFQLVRKRGRSEVWNLFGQVVDTLTGNRLPYVACYACKVLYTDTGGGTGNMTRHRCSVGHSYRSIAGSSTDTVSEMNTQSSFESVNNLMIGNGPSSPETTYVQDTTASYSVSAREAFIQSGNTHSSGARGSASSGFMSAGSQSMSSNLASLDSLGSSVVGGSGLRSCSITSTHPHSHQSASSSSAGGSGSGAPPPPPPPSQPLRPAPTTSGHQGPPAGSFGPGYVFTQADRQLFAHAVVQFCAQDLHNYDVVEGEGFKNLVETVLFIGRRSHGDVNSSSFDPVRNLIPSSKQLKQVFVTQDQFVRNATSADLGAASEIGASFSCQSVTFAEEKYLSISCNYITDDWMITRRSLRVEKCALEEVGELLAEILRDYNLDGAKTVLLTLDFELNPSLLNKLPKNVVVVRNINRAINQILRQSLSECVEKSEAISKFIDLCYRIVKKLNGLNALSESLPHKFFSGLEEHTSSLDKRFDYADGVYLTIKFVKEHIEQILMLFNKERTLNDLIAEIHLIDWQLAKDLEQFLEPFYDTIQIFKDSKQPHFQQILPEWYALIHECQVQSGESLEGSETNVSKSPSPPQPSSSRIPTLHTSATVIVDSNPTSSELSSPPIQKICALTFTPDEPNPKSKWLALVQKTANERLKEWAEKNMLLEHKISTALNPRSVVYSRIRKLVGLSKPKRERQVDISTGDEPAKKRREFLDRLEDCAAEDDELDCYLRTSFSPNQTKNVLEFWASIGESQFPRLAKLARFLLPTSGACAPLALSQPSSPLTASDINTLLILRPEVLNSLNRSHTNPRAAFPRI